MSRTAWTEVRLRYVADLNPPTPAEVRMQPDTEVTFLPMEAIREFGGFEGSRVRRIGDVLAGYSYFQDGDIVFAKVTPCFENGKASVIQDLQGGFGFGTTEVTVVRPKESIDRRFLFYVLIEDRFAQFGKASMTGAGGLKRVPDSFTKNYRLRLPALDEQKSIADYLDFETTEIDAFIADQEELIRLLNERRRSALHAVAGTIGAARQVRLRYLYRQSREANRSDLQVLSVYRDFGVIPKSSRSDNFNKTPEDVSRYLVVRPGYLVINKMKAWQGSLGISSHTGIVSPDYEVLIPTSNELSLNYVHHMLRSPDFVANYAVRSVGIRPSQWRLYWDQMKDIAIPVPDLAVQEDFLRNLRSETAEIDAAIADARESIELSKERRAAVISAAVTGKIDVRDFAIIGQATIQGDPIGVA